MNAHWYGPYGYATYQPNTPSDGHEQALERIHEAIADARHDELFYEYLLSVAPTEQEKQVITGIRDDERKHNSFFQQIYKRLTGQRQRQSDTAELFQKPASYLDGIEQALMGELKAFEKYRVIYKSIPVQYRDTIFEIMTDEMKHASYYNWLYAKNK
ncbi:ferritin-like domain-containing protein [Brevibacillus nitrificans]|uniref:ferritin-like domain-containing protein n=1 Tax=Brevibacillus nitrificans TaxID=651560 RepID=UPI002E1B6EBF|nr:ferritin-like domain-containing protein [Brevibacillus nitrificans]